MVGVVVGSEVGGETNFCRVGLNVGGEMGRRVKSLMGGVGTGGALYVGRDGVLAGFEGVPTAPEDPALEGENTPPDTIPLFDEADCAGSTKNSSSSTWDKTPDEIDPVDDFGG
mmetsp:Transcript_13341/g.15321  ORF Transcript_13341/g.15321 Transcript_13341/m.15321 type:complete len:113 (+) Transcript_13341:509-847(+)